MEGCMALDCGNISNEGRVRFFSVMRELLSCVKSFNLVNFAGFKKVTMNLLK